MIGFVRCYVVEGERNASSVWVCCVCVVVVRIVRTLAARVEPGSYLVSTSSVDASGRSADTAPVSKSSAWLEGVTATVGAVGPRECAVSHPKASPRITHARGARGQPVSDGQRSESAAASIV